MADGGVKVENLSRTLRELKKIGLRVEDLKDAFAQIASEATDAIVRHTPKRSGRLAGSVRGNRAQGKAVVRAGRAAVPYAGAINYGWSARNIEPAQFMQKGEQEYQPQAVRRLEAEINETIRRSGLT